MPRAMLISALLLLGICLLQRHCSCAAEIAVRVSRSDLSPIPERALLNDDEVRLAGRSARRWMGENPKTLSKRQAILDSPSVSPKHKRLRVLQETNQFPPERRAEAWSRYHGRTSQQQLRYYQQLERFHALRRLDRMPLDVRRIIMRPVIAEKILQRFWAVHGRAVILSILYKAKQEFLSGLAQGHPSKTRLLDHILTAHRYTRHRPKPTLIDELINHAGPTEREITVHFPFFFDARPLINALWQVEARRRLSDPIRTARSQFETQALECIRRIDRRPQMGLLRVFIPWHRGRSFQLHHNHFALEFPITSPLRLAVLAALTYGQELYPVTSEHVYRGRTFRYDDEFRQRLDVPAFVREGWSPRAELRRQGIATDVPPGFPLARSPSPPARGHSTSASRGSS